MTGRLREICRRLLLDGTVDVVIGYGDRGPVFVTRPEDAGKLSWHERCFNNLTVYLKRKEIRALGKPAIVVKGCDERALIVLEKESQIERKDVYVIGAPCAGLGLKKCDACTVRNPRFADENAGEPVEQPDPRPPAAPAPGGIEFWKTELARCVKCYACRQVCPLCYCERCLTDKNRPQVIDTSASLKGNFAWHITRAFHLAGRCTGCGECTRACPAGIDLGRLNRAAAIAVQQQFGYVPGMDPAAEPVIGCYSLQDREGFIR